MLLRHTDNFNRTLQHDHVSAAEGQAIATMTTASLATPRNDGHFDLFWEKVQQMASERDVNEPKLPRQQKRPARFEEGMAPPEFHSTVKEFYCHIYYEALDLIVESIRDRYDQPGYRVYQCLSHDDVIHQRHRPGGKLHTNPGVRAGKVTSAPNTSIYGYIN